MGVGTLTRKGALTRRVRLINGLSCVRFLVNGQRLVNVHEAR